MSFIVPTRHPCDLVFFLPPLCDKHGGRLNRYLGIFTYFSNPGPAVSRGGGSSFPAFDAGPIRSAASRPQGRTAARAFMRGSRRRGAERPRTGGGHPRIVTLNPVQSPFSLWSSPRKRGSRFDFLVHTKAQRHEDARMDTERPRAGEGPSLLRHSRVGGNPMPQCAVRASWYAVPGIPLSPEFPSSAWRGKAVRRPVASGSLRIAGPAPFAILAQVSHCAPAMENEDGCRRPDGRPQ